MMVAAGQSDDPVNPQPSLLGYPGLFRAIGAGGLPAKSFGGSAWIDRINRNPGFLTITTIGASGFVSVHKRVAFDVQVNINRRILVRRADQLSLGQQNLVAFGFGGCPEWNCYPWRLTPVVFFPPAQIMSVLRDPHTGALLNTAGFFNEYPWAMRRTQEGMGEIVLGSHIVLKDFDEDGRGAAFALRPHISIPTRYSATALSNSGVQTGAVEYGMDLLLEGHAGKMLGVYANAGYTHVTNPSHGSSTQVGLYDYIPTRLGVNIPRTSRIQFLAEYDADFFQIGGGTPNQAGGTVTDGTVGLRLFPASWVSLTAGYRHTLNHSQFGGDKNGFVAQVSVSHVPTAAVPPPTPPTVTCSAQPASVRAGTPVTLTATATSNTPGATLAYTWASTGGHVEGTGPNARLDTTGLAPGTYTVTLRVDDGRGGFADCTSTVTIVPPPPPPPPPKPPTVTCGIDRTAVNPGETVTLTATGNSPDNRPLNYDWTVTGGRTAGSGASVRWDTTGLADGTYTGTVRVTDDRGLADSCSVRLAVKAPPPPPRAARLNECKFKDRTARVDNVCKAVLDDVALRLQNEPESRAAVIGSATPTETRLKRYAELAAERASNVKVYLVKDKGVDAGRIEVRTNPDTSTVQIWLIPRGASISDVPGAIAPEKMPAAKGAKKASP
jgi:outer membrane protein OmpA-like peptidoglycan-associated protein